MERLIPDPGFPDDDGSAPAALTAALAAYASGGDGHDVLHALTRSRLLVPVVAVLGEVEYDEAGLTHDKTSDMAAVLIQRGDGQRALLAFTSMSAMALWNPDGRPVPVMSRLAATSAIQDGAAALVIDISGPVRFVVDGDDLSALAAGWQVVRVGERSAWIGASVD